MDSEITVVGAGVVGSSLACLLSKQGIKVTLLDRGSPLSLSKSSILQDRTLALNLSSINLFKELNIWHELKKQTTPFERMFVWDSKGSSPLEFLAEEIKKKELGYIISNNTILKSLNKLIQDSPKITLKQQTELSGIDIKENEICISFLGGERISSKLIIGADGINSTLRKKAKIKTRTWSYDQRAFVAGLKTEKFHEYTAWQLFTPTGPIALLPFDLMEGSNISLVWSAEIDYAEKLQKLTQKEFVKELEEKTEQILGKIDLKTDIRSFPLNQLHAKSYFSERIALVGDSAHSFHPLAGQGLNIGLSDVTSLSAVLIKARRSGLDIGSKRTLKDYERSRKIPNLTMAALMELFKEGFETSDPWVKLARNFAFNMATKNSTLKKRVIKEAAGIT